MTEKDLLSGLPKAIAEATRAQTEAANPLTSAWVEASAGSGKTQVLVQRVLRLLLSGVPPHKILCLTFTKAAAANMALRLGATLSSWSTLPASKLDSLLSELFGGLPPTAETRELARTLFVRTLDAPGGLQFQTIHSFCQSVLARFPLEANVPVGFQVLEDRASQILLNEARLSTYHQALAEGETTPLGRSLIALLKVFNGDDVLKILTNAVQHHDTYAELIEKHHGHAFAIQALWAKSGLAPFTTHEACVRNFLEHMRERIPLLEPFCRDLLADTETVSNRNLGEALAPILAAEGPPDTALISNLINDCLIKERSKAKAPKAKFLGKNPAYKATAEALERELVLLCAQEREIETLTTSSHVFVLASEMLARYGRLKQHHGALDFNDLIHKTAALISDVGSAWVLYKLDGGIDHVLVDEAQDTNSAQWSILNALTTEFFSGIDGRRANDPLFPTVFAVGDYKQSIFSFQGAEPASFRQAKEHYSAALSSMNSHLLKRNFTVSFRTSQPVLDLVDRVFENPEACEGLEGYETHKAARDGRAGHLELWPLLRDDPNNPAQQKSTTRLADAIASEIERLVSQEKVATQNRPVSYGDIMILVPKRREIAPAIVKSCKQRGIPISGLDRMVLTDPLAVQDLMALVKFLLLPDDDLSLACVLKSPFIRLHEEGLFQLAHKRPKDQSLWAALHVQAEGDVLLAQAKDWLAGWLSRADFETPYTLLSAVMAATCPQSPKSGRHALIQQLGDEAKDALDEFLSAALSYEQEEAPSLQGFLKWVETSDIEVKRQLDQVSGQVRLMTVHGSKGLEAPIVILADKPDLPSFKGKILPPDVPGEFPLIAPFRALESPEASRRRHALTEKAIQEYHRLLYVALTRAEERLIITAATSLKGPSENGKKPWHFLIEEGLRKCNATETDDGRLVFSEAQTAEPLAKKKELQQNLPTITSADISWLFYPAPPEPSPSNPLTASAHLDDEEGLSPLAGETSWRFNRGQLLHRLLQTLPDIAPSERKTTALNWLLGQEIPTPQAHLLVKEVLQVIEHPDYGFIFGQGSRAEVPLTGVVGAFVVSAQIDRLVELADDIWIVDYKTNRPPAQTLEEVPLVYVQQLARYKALIQRIYPDKKVHCALLWTNVPRLMPLPDDMLEILPSTP